MLAFETIMNDETFDWLNYDFDTEQETLWGMNFMSESNKWRYFYYIPNFCNPQMFNSSSDSLIMLIKQLLISPSWKANLRANTKSLHEIFNLFPRSK